MLPVIDRYIKDLKIKEFEIVEKFIPYTIFSEKNTPISIDQLGSNEVAFVNKIVVIGGLNDLEKSFIKVESSVNVTDYSFFMRAYNIQGLDICCESDYPSIHTGFLRVFYEQNNFCLTKIKKGYLHYYLLRKKDKYTCKP